VPMSPSAIGNAPLANYSAMDAAADKLTAPAPSPLVAGTTSPAASVSPGGPYDPNSYKPSTGAATTAATSQSTAAPDRYQITGDRYGITPVGSNPATGPESPISAENLPAAAPVISSPSGNRYGLSTPTTTATNDLASQPQYDPTVMAPPMPLAPSPAPVTVASLTAAPTTPTTPVTQQAIVAGQYRPGGTTSYIGSIPVRPVEVANLPSTPTTAMPTTPTTTGTQPWTPAGTSPQPTPSTGTQRY
jgi:hypothetical protein